MAPDVEEDWLCVEKRCGCCGNTATAHSASLALSDWILIVEGSRLIRAILPLREIIGWRKWWLLLNFHCGLAHQLGETATWRFLDCLEALKLNIGKTDNVEVCGANLEDLKLLQIGLGTPNIAWLIIIFPV